jgi:hypothetical protein
VTDDGQLVDPTDPRARWLLVGEGGELPWDVAARYGLVAPEEDGPVQQEVRAQGRRVRRAADKRLKRVEDK